MNPLDQLKEDINKLEQNNGAMAAIVQVPIARANELLGYSMQEWELWSKGWLTKGEIQKMFTNKKNIGSAALGGLILGYCKIHVAENFAQDVPEVTFIQELKQ